MAEPARIALTDLTFSIEGKQIIHGITLDLRHKRLGIVGRNGSGKSTLARLIAGLVSPSAGTLRVNDTDLVKDRRAALFEVGILFQNPDHQIIFPTVREELAFGLEQQGLSKTEVAETITAVLARFGLDHWKDSYVNTLSHGQKHLLTLMTVTAMQPKLVILDEPFAGLDIPTKTQLSRYLKLYEGSLVHITHDPADLEGYDHLLWIDQGRIKMEGPFSQVMPEYKAAMIEEGQADDLAHLAG